MPGSHSAADLLNGLVSDLAPLWPPLYHKEVGLRVSQVLLALTSGNQKLPCVRANSPSVQAPLGLLSGVLQDASPQEPGLLAGAPSQAHGWWLSTPVALRADEPSCFPEDSYGRSQKHSGPQPRGRRSERDIAVGESVSLSESGI